MSVRSLGILLLKFWGVVTLVSGVISMSGTALTFVAPGIGGSAEGAIRYALMSNGLVALLSVIFGVILLAQAERIVVFIAPEPSTAPDDSPYTTVDLQSVVFGGLGVYFAIGALKDIATLVLAIARQPAWSEESQFMFTLEAHQAQLAGAAVQLVAAMILLIRRHQLARLWSRIRPMAATDRDSSGTEA